jgi:hypothetical protein
VFGVECDRSVHIELGRKRRDGFRRPFALAAMTDARREDCVRSHLSLRAEKCDQRSGTLPAANGEALCVKTAVGGNAILAFVGLFSVTDERDAIRRHYRLPQTWRQVNSASKR